MQIYHWYIDMTDAAPRARAAAMMIFFHARTRQRARGIEFILWVHLNSEFTGDTLQPNLNFKEMTIYNTVHCQKN